MPYLGLQHARKIKESTINIRHCSCLVNNFSCQPQKKDKKKQMRFGTKNLHFQQKQYDITHKNLVNRTGKGKRMNTDRNEVNDLSQIKYIRLQSSSSNSQERHPQILFSHLVSFSLLLERLQHCYSTMLVFQSP